MAKRLDALTQWLNSTLDVMPAEITPASSDASFRRYFRVRVPGHSFIAMDAPPDKEDSRPFIKVAEMMHQAGLQVPRVLHADLAQGFLLLTDLGDRQYLAQLNDATVERLYGDALDALLTLQTRGPRGAELPPYDHALLLREMGLFRDWFLDAHLNLPLSATQAAIVESTFESLARSALEQPQVCVHRDYHSRNLMLTATANPGVLDFQDAVIGPITYDLVSLLRDCYVSWPPAQVEAWALAYLRRAQGVGLVSADSEAHWLRWFDWMGAQRHLKAIGIFARLNRRDGKPGYLNDIPRTLGYVVDVAGRYPELHGLHRLLIEAVVPALEARRSAV